MKTKLLMFVIALLGILLIYKSWPRFIDQTPTLKILSVTTNTFIVPAHESRGQDPEFITDTNGFLKANPSATNKVQIPTTTNQVEVTIVGFKDKSGKDVEFMRRELMITPKK